MPRTNILVVVVDGLRASALGAYGNTSFPTPALDRLAAQGMLFDACYSPATDLNDICRALWQSQLPARLLGLSSPETDRQSQVAVNLPAALGDEHRLKLVSDEPAVVALGENIFDECISVDSWLVDDREAPRAHDVADTQLARLFAAAGEEAAESESQLIWVHSRGMYGAWDAPLDLQESLLDDGDPPPVVSTNSPTIRVGGTVDPDAAFRFGCAYAAQVMALDACWDALMSCIDAMRDSKWLIALIGARGFPLGEHGQIGSVDGRLSVEQLHVPWIIRFPDGRGAMARTAALTSHIDLLPTLSGWLGQSTTHQSCDGASALPLENDPHAPWRNSLMSYDASGCYSFRNASWCLRGNAGSVPTVAAANAASPPVELYVRPDDRFEANDVASLCPDIVEELEMEVAKSLRSFPGGND